MKKSSFIMIAFAVAVVFVFTAAYAGAESRKCPLGKDGGKGYGHKFGIDAEELDLSEDQERYFKRLKSDYRKAVVKKKAAIELAKIDLHELMAADIVKLDAVKIALEKKATLKVDLKYFRIKTREDFKRVLTEEQQDILRDSGSSDSGHARGGYGGYGYGKKCSQSD